jgi:hypothetical protein
MERLKTRQRLAKMSDASIPQIRPLVQIPENEAEITHLATKIRVNSILNQEEKGIPRRIKSHITPEQLAEFQQVENTPIEINGQFYRMHPASIPEPELEPEPPLPEDFTEQINEAITNALGEFQRGENMLVENTGNSKQLDEDYNREIGTMNREIVGAVVQQNAAKRDLLIRSKKDLEREYVRIKADLEARDTMIKDELTQRRIAIDALRQDFQNDAAINDTRLAERKAIRQANQDSIRGYEENLKSLNRSYNLRQEQGESQEDYLARIKEQSNVIEDPTLTYDRFNLFEGKKFKDNLKEIIRDSAVVEFAYNTLFQDDDASISELNKMFTQVKSRYEKLYGKVQLKDDDLVKFLKSVRENPEQEAPKPVVVNDLEPKYSALKKLSKPKLVGIVIDLILKYKGEYRLMFKDKEVRLFQGGRGGFNFETNEKILPLISAGKPLLIFSITAMMEQMKQDGPDSYRRRNKLLNEETKGEYGEGFGIQIDKLPKRCMLGKVEIDLHKLFYKNVLSITYNGLKIVGFKNSPVSDAFVKVVMDLCKGESNETNLGEEEGLFDALIHVAGIHKKVGHTANKSIERLKQRLQLVGGEIQAGNNNDMIKKELRDIVFKLSHLGAITKNSALDYLKQF